MAEGRDGSRALALLQFAIAVLWAAPFGWLLVSAFSGRSESGGALLPTIENFVTVLTRTSFPREVANSLIVAAASTIFGIVLGAPCAHALAHRWRRVLAWGVVVRMVPPVAIALPVLAAPVLAGAGMPLVICLHTAETTALSVWLLRGVFAQVPRELEEAAISAGLGPWGRFLFVSLPLAKAGLIAVALVCFLVSVNEFVFASMIGAEGGVITASVGLLRLAEAESAVWGSFAAAGTLLTLPVLIIVWLLRSAIVSGFAPRPAGGE